MIKSFESKELIDNYKIAEFCGWVLSYDGDFYSWNHPYKKHGIRHTKFKNMAGKYLPNYFKDLNAIFEAESLLSDVQKYQYLNELNNIKGSYFDKTCHIPCEVRAKALLKVIEKTLTFNFFLL